MACGKITLRTNTKLVIRELFITGTFSCLALPWTVNDIGTSGRDCRSHQLRRRCFSLNGGLTKLGWEQEHSRLSRSFRLLPTPESWTMTPSGCSESRLWQWLMRDATSICNA